MDLQANVLNLPLPPKSCTKIFAAHLLEHLMPDEASAALGHWMSLLVKGGDLGVLVPDVQRMAQEYGRGGFSKQLIIEAIGGERDPNDPYALHVTVYSAAQLEWFVERETGKAATPMVLSEWPVVSGADWQVGVTVRA